MFFTFNIFLGFSASQRDKEASFTFYYSLSLALFIYLLIFSNSRHEGRTWYSSHRGRLWIASTVKEPSHEEIQELENFYRNHYGKEDLHFPQHYPSGCLLGCVDVVDVLPQESYRLQYPNGESESPYVFICENPHELFVKFPNKGQHKICKLHFNIYNQHRWCQVRKSWDLL